MYTFKFDFETYARLVHVTNRESGRRPYPEQKFVALRLSGR